MKLIKKLPILTALILAFSLYGQSAYANNFFWEFNVGAGDFEPEVGNDESITLFSGAFGGFFTNLISYEIQLGAGWENQDGIGGTPGVSHAAGLIGLNLGTRNAHVFLMGGVGVYDIDTSINNTDGEGAAIAFGINLYANEQSGLTFEALNIKDDDVGEYGIISLGYKRKF